MGKQELIREVVKTTDGQVDGKTARAILDTAFAAIGRGLQAEQRVAWPGFGVFVVRERAARAARNPQTGEGIHVEARRTVVFKPAAALKEGL